MNVIRSHLVPPMLLASLGFIIVAAVFVNPLREVSIEDDFSYAWTVKRLIETGGYEIHQWASANPLIQVYWGVLFEHVLGPHYGSLRVSTLVMAFVGVLALYGLAREHGLKASMAGFITMVLVSCPLFLLFSFSFMTDVPFLAWITVALYFYTRAIRSQSYLWMIIASVAGAIAVFSRQFGVAFVGALLILWFSDRSRRQTYLFMLGALLPMIAATWQFLQGTQTHTWGMSYAMVSQIEHLTSFRKLVGQTLWRPAIVMQYMAFFSVPLAICAMSAVLREFYPERKTLVEMFRRRDVQLLIGFSVYVAIVMMKERHLMPLLPWYFYELWNLGPIERGLITAFTVTGAIAYMRFFLLRYLGEAGWSRLSPQERLLDLVTLILFAVHLVLFQMGDRYLLCLLPFTLIVVGKQVQELPLGTHRAAVLSCVLMFLVSAMWVRGTLEREDALWKACESLRMQGVEKTEIYGSFAWNTNYRIDEYFSGIGREHPEETTYDLIFRWMPEIRRTATYVIVPENDKSAETLSGESEPIARIPYRTMLFQKNYALVVKKAP